MEILFKELAAGEEEELISLLTGERWEFHSLPEISSDNVKEQLQKGYFQNSGVKTFWISEEHKGKIGIIRLFDLGSEPGSTETPLFDLKIKKEFSGRGIGKQAVKWLVDYVFTNYPAKYRFEATTRIDNIAMRKVLESSGFVKEAHYRQAWPDEDGNKHDCAGYAVLRSDWENNIKTPIQFNL